jgi:DNA polymerase I-like protein with 3'-5' exonuclease and polymerase domains
MLIECDAKALEWRVACFLSQDRVGIQEIKDGVDLHTDNQRRFGLPNRTLAKVFLFRLIYGGSAYSYCHDAEFMGVSTKEKFWQEVIDRTYQKYVGLHQWHRSIMQEVRATGCLSVPSGRGYVFASDWRGKWPDTQIKNYPVQGFSADIMMLARISIYRRMRHLREDGLVLANTVHDSVLVDCEARHEGFVRATMEDVFRDLDKTVSRCFRCDFNVPMECEIKAGPNWGEMK